MQNFNSDKAKIYKLKDIPLKVACAPVQEHNNEEDRVKVRDDSSSTDNGTPCQTHDPVSDVVWLARVCPPAASKKAVAEKRSATA